MANDKQNPGAQRHAEGMHGEKTHRRFIEQLQTGSASDEVRTEASDIEGRHRLHQDREQHDEAEKNSEKVEALREIKRGNIDENVLGHARVPHEGDSR
jgi:hypothetical protein